MRISDWSSDVCSSDLQYLIRRRLFGARARTGGDAQIAAILIALAVRHHGRAFIYVVHLVHASGRIWHAPPEGQEDRKSVVLGKTVSGRVDLGGRRNLNKKQ